MNALRSLDIGNAKGSVAPRPALCGRLPVPWGELLNFRGHRRYDARAIYFASGRQSVSQPRALVACMRRNECRVVYSDV
jgi:hypothetical protein